MKRTRGEGIAAALAHVSGKPVDEVFIEMNLVVVPMMEDPSGLKEEITEDEYQQYIEVAKKEGAGILNWLIQGAKEGFKLPEN